MTRTGRLLLIRHGETDDNASRLICGWTDSCLSARGREQVRRLAAIGASLGIERLYASPLQRAWHTAAALGDGIGLRPTSVDDLREIHFGHCEGSTIEEFQARYPDLHAIWRDGRDADLPWPGGESRLQFRARVMRVLTPIEAESRDACVAVVCHGGVIASYLAARFGAGGNWLDFSVRNCSISVVGWHDGQPALIGHDRIDHLGAPCGLDSGPARR